MHSLKTRITLLTVWVTVIAVTVVSLLSVLFIRNTEKQQSDQLLYLLCETGEKNLDYYFTSVEKSVRKVAGFAENDLNGLDDERLEGHVERVRVFFDEMAHKTNGVLTYYYRIDPEVSTKVRGFWYTNLDGDDFTEHEVTDISQYDTSDTSKLVWFTVPKSTGNPVWQPPYITDNLDKRVISYNIPVSFRGQFVGVIGIEIDYSVMAEQVKSIRLYKNGYAFLNEADGTLIYHPRIDVPSLAEEDRPKAPEGLLSDSTFIRYTFEGVEREAAWLKLSNGMRLNVSVPVNETDGDWEQLIRQILIVSAGVLLLLILFTLYYSGHITRPLKQLTDAARQVDGGNYDVEPKYDRDDEIGHLTKTFNGLVGHMKEHINELNRRANVDALTSVRNKGAFNTYIEEMQARLDGMKEKPPFAVGIFDCDNLKTINDRYGHEKGDIYLKTACRLICRIFQHSPVFRIGGDEFAVILQNDDFRNRDELIRSFEESAGILSMSTENEWEQAHVSMGIAVFDPKADYSVVDTVRRADSLMYVSKRARKESPDGGSSPAQLQK